MTGAAGRYFDGRSAGRHRVEVTLDERAGELMVDGSSLPAPLRWPVGRLRAISDHARGYGLTLMLHAESGDESPRDPARLEVFEPGLVRDLERLCPNLYRKDIHKGSWPKLIRRALIALAAVIAMLFFILPRMADTLATLIPVEREIAFGKAVTAQVERALGGTQIGELRCSDAEGQAALDRMLARLTRGRRLEYELNVVVFDHPMVNAFAAPGGQIVLMRGLLEKAPGRDAVAAVLAHEIGHVERRDATRHALRAAGTAGLVSMVLGDFTGGAAAVVLGERVLQASYTRTAEAEADAFALDMLNRAQIDSTGMARFFDRLADEDGGTSLPEYFSSHPASAERAEMARANAADQVATTAVLNDEDWQALKGICKGR